MNWESICQWICALTRNWHTKIDSSSPMLMPIFFSSCFFNGQHTSFLHWFKHTRWRWRQASSQQANSIFKLARIDWLASKWSILLPAQCDSHKTAKHQPWSLSLSRVFVCEHWLAVSCQRFQLYRERKKTHAQSRACCCLCVYFLNEVSQIWIELCGKCIWQRCIK